MAAVLNFDIFANDKTGRAFDQIKNKVKSLDDSFGKLKKAAIMLGGGAAIFGWLKGASSAAEHIDELSTRLGISSRVLSQYQLIAGETGVELDTIAKGMQQLAKNSVEAAEKQGEARDALNSLGIDAKKFSTLPIDTKFAVLAEAMKGIEDPSKRVQLSMALMGKGGAEMLQVMAEGGQGLQDMQDKADGLGITLNNVETSAIDSMMDAFGNLGLQALALGQHFIAQVAPAIELVAKALQVVLAGAIVIVRDGFKSMVQVMLNAIGSVANGFAWLTDKLSVLPGDVGEAFKTMSTSLSNYGDVLSDVKYEQDGVTDSQKKQNAEWNKTAGILDKVKGSLPNGKTNAELKQNNQLLGEAKRIFEQTRTPLEKYNAEMEKLKKLYDMKLIDTDTFSRAQGKAFTDLRNDMQNTGKISGDVAGKISLDWKQAASQAGGDWIDALMGMNGGFDSLRENALNSLKEIATSMAKTFLNKQLGIGQTSLPWLSGGSDGGGGLSGIVSGLGDWFGGFFAEGGNFLGGKPIVVGERGPEIIMPRSGGSVVSNDNLRGSTVINHFHFPQGTDVASFRRSQGQLEAMMASSSQRGMRNL